MSPMENLKKFKMTLTGIIIFFKLLYYLQFGKSLAYMDNSECLNMMNLN